MLRPKHSRRRNANRSVAARKNPLAVRVNRFEDRVMLSSNPLPGTGVLGSLWQPNAFIGPIDQANTHQSISGQHISPEHAAVGIEDVVQAPGAGHWFQKETGQTASLPTNSSNGLSPTTPGQVPPVSANSNENSADTQQGQQALNAQSAGDKNGRLGFVGPQFVNAPGSVITSHTIGQGLKNPPPGYDQAGVSPNVGVFGNTLVNNPALDGSTQDFTQSETTNLAFGNTILVAYNDSSTFNGFAPNGHFTAWSISTDGGTTFTDKHALPTSSTGDAGDPSLGYNSTSGNVYLSTLSFSTYFGNPAISFFTSTDGGQTFGAAVNSAPGFAQGDFLDKDWMAVDNAPGAGQGTIYQSFTDFTSYGGVGIYLTKSTDGGHTWGPNGGTLIATGYVQGSYVIVGPDHSVYVFYWNGNNFPEQLTMRKSTDGGATFGPNITVATLNTFGINGDLGLGFRSNAFPHVAINPKSGALYVAYNDSTNNGDRANVYFTQSTDGGQTWSSALQVNDDQTTNDQWQPTITVKPDGSQVFLSWYDRRLDPNNNLIAVFGAIGNADPNTGAVTFSNPNFRIDNAQTNGNAGFQPAYNIDPLIAGGYMGDYDTSTALGNNFYTTWGDNRDLNSTGQFYQPDVRFARIDTGLSVTGSTPANGSEVSTTPAQYVIDMSDPIVATGLNPGSLLVDGQPATGVSIDATDTILTFTFTTDPITQKGLQTMSIAAGAFTRQSDGAPSEAFSASFRYDPSPITVVSSNPANNAVLQNGLTSLALTFSEPFDPKTILASNLVLSVGTVTGVSVDPTDTIATYTISGVPEGPVTATLPAGVVTDQYGDPSQSSFTATFLVDLLNQSYPVPLQGKPPAGGLIYDPMVSDTIFYAGDQHNYSITLSGGQTASVVVTPAAGLQATVSIVDSSNNVLGTATSAAPGTLAVLQTVPISSTGTYYVEVTGANNTTGTYTAQLYLNALLQPEHFGGTPGQDDTIGSATPLDSSFVNIGYGASRGAVVGQVPGGLTAGDVIVNERAYPFGGSVDIFDTNGNLLETISNSALSAGVISGVELGPDNTLYVGVDTSNGGYGGGGNGGELVHMDLHGNVLGTIPLPNDTFNYYYYPFGYEIAADGSLWIAQPNSGNIIHTDGNGNLLNSWSVGGIPESVTVRADGQVFVANPGVGEVQQLDPGTGTVTDFANYSGAIGAHFAAPGGNGDLVVADYNSSVYYLNSSGGVDQTISGPGPNMGEPDPSGNTFVVSYGYDQLRKYDSSGNLLFANSLSGNPTQLAVLGTDQAPPPAPDTTDFYSFSLAAGQSASVVISDTSGSAATITLEDGSGNVLALGHPVSKGESIDNFFSASGGTYYVKVTGNDSGYNLVVTRGSDFDLHQNSQLSHAQPLAANGTVLGAVVNGGALYAMEWQPSFPLLVHAVDPASGTFTSTINVTAGNITNPYGENMAFDGTNLYYNDGPFFGDNNIYKIDPTSGAILSTITPQEPYYLFGIAYGAGAIWATDSYNIWELDPNTGAVIKELPGVLDGSATGLSYDPDHNVLWAVSQFHRIFEVDPNTGAVIKEGSDSPAGYEQDMAYANGQLFVSEAINFGQTDISVYDPNTLALVNRFSYPNVPYFLSGLGGDGLGGSGQDYYSFNVNAGDNLSLAVSTPSENPGAEFENTLQPQLDLYDANGNLVATSTNGQLNWTALTSGTYDVRVSGQNKTTGEYVLNVAGNTGGLSPFTVTGTNPANGANLQSLSSVTVSFSQPVLQTSLSTSDFTIDGNNATGFTVVDDHTVTFTFPTLPTGSVYNQANSFTVSGVQDLQGQTLTPYTATVYLTNIPPSIVSSSIIIHSTLPAGNISEVITFNEAVNPALVNASSFSLSGQYRNASYAVGSFSFDATDTVLTVNYTSIPSDAYTFTLQANAIQNLVGQTLSGGNFVLPFFADSQPTGFPTLQQDNPGGSLIYDPTATDVIVFGGEYKTFPIALNANETLTLDVTSGSTLQPQVNFIAPNGVTVIGTATATGAGGEAFLNLQPVATTGTYYVQVTGANNTKGLFTVQAVLNAALESSDHGGSPDNSIGTASSDLTNSMINLGNGISRGAVIGGFRAGLNNGDVFVVTRSTSNPFFGGTILHLDSNGNIISSFSPSQLGVGTPTALHLGPNDDLYVAVNINGNGVNGELLHFTDGGTFLGSIPVPNDTGLPQFLSPFGFSIQNNNGTLTFWVAQVNGGKITEIDTSGNVLAQYSVGGAPLADAYNPIDGNVYYVDAFSGGLYQLNTSNGQATYLTYAYSPSALNVNPDGTIWTSTYFGLARFDTSGNLLQYLFDGNGTVWPQEDPSANVWTSEFFAQSASKFDPNGNFLTSTFLGGYGMGLAVTGVDAPITVIPNDNQDFYSLSLTKGEAVTITVNGNATLQLDDGSGNQLAIGSTGAQGVNEIISNFVAQSTGTYYIQVSGTKGAYNLVATENAAFDIEPNNSPAQAQDITATEKTGSGGAIGILQSSGSVALGAGFDSLHFTNTSCGCLPPDNGMAVGDGYVVAAVNTAIRFSTQSGTNLLTEELTTFFGSGSGGDPQVVFDDVAQRWYILSLNSGFSGLLFKVSNDANPMDGFSQTYTFNNFSGGLPDFPKVGFNNDAVMIMVDNFGPNQVTYIAIDKAQLLAGNMVSYQYTYGNFSTAFDVEPARMRGDTVAGGPMYLVGETLDSQGVPGLQILTVTNELSNSPVFKETDLAVDPYGQPVGATQPGGGSITANTSFIISVDWRNGVLAAAHSVSVAADGFSTTRARWYEIAADSQGANPVSLIDQGTVDQGPGVSTWMPAVALDAKGDLGMIFMESSATEFMSVYDAAHVYGSTPGSNTTPIVAQAGADTLAYSFRSGDYSSLMVDPSNPNTFWGSSEYSPPNSGSDIWATNITSFATAPPVDQDWYSVSANAGDKLAGSIKIPFSGNGQFADSLNPSVALYDGNGNLVAGGDNQTSFSYTVGTAGTYYVEAYSTDGSKGEYVLSVTGATGGLPDFHVTKASPSGPPVIQPPSTITVDFNQSILISSISASDLTITDSGNTLTATGFTVVNDHEVIFNLPALPQVGDYVDHHVDVVGGTIQDISGQYVDDYQFDVFTDNVPPSIISSSLTPNQVVQAGTVTEVLTFSEAMNASLIHSYDFTLYGSYRNQYYSPASWSWDPTGTVLTVVYNNVPDDAYSFSIYPPDFQDNVGLGLTSGFSVNFYADIDLTGPAPFPTNFTPASVPGSLVYDPSATNVIDLPGDSETYSLTVPANETITVLVTSSAIQPTVKVYGPSHNLLGSASANAVGANALLNTVLATQTGTYYITIGDAGTNTGLYTAQVTINSALQNKLYLGSPDNTPATAQDLSGSSVALGTRGSSRLAVEGQFNSSPDLYKFQLQQGQSVGAVLDLAAAPKNIFPNITTYADYSQPTSVTYADLNGDGMPDMVVSNFYSGVYVRYNNGNGTFGNPVYLWSGYGAEHVAVGDLGNGQNDVVFTDTYGGGSGQSVGVLMNSGGGNFGAPIYSFLGYNTTGVVIAHLEGASQPADIAVTDFYDNQVIIGIGNGTGSFTMGNSYATGSNPFRVVAGDLNGDGYPDLVTANVSGGFNNTGNLTVLINKGDGLADFNTPTSILTAPDYTYGVVLGDFNGDGHLDIASTNFYSGKVSILLGNGDGTFGPVTNISVGPTNAGTYGIAAADINGDGHTDLAVVNYYQGQIALLYGNGDGTFQSPQTVSGGYGASQIYLGDLNGDGQTDISTVDYYDIGVYLNAFSQVHIELLDSNGNVVATGVTGATNVNESITNYVAQNTGTYYIEVFGTGSNRNYSVVVTRGATFDLDPNHSLAQAQPIGPSLGALGAIVNGSGAALDNNFDNLHFTNTSCGCLPPDNGFAVGDGYVMSAVNTAIRISDTSGHVYMTEELSQFFAPLGQGSGGDPFIVFDDVAQRWYVTTLTNGFSAIEMAVSNDANPLHGFSMMTTFSNWSGGLPDFPKVGYNNDAIILMVDNFGPNQVTYVAIDKHALLTQGQWVTYQYTYGNFNTAFDVEPARMRGDTTAGGPMYLVGETLDSQGVPGIQVVKLTNELSNSPTFSETDFNVGNYGEPAAAAQPGGGGITTNTSFIVSVDWRNGNLVAAHNVSVPADGYSTSRAQWYEFAADAQGANPLSLTQMGTVNQGPGVSEFMPAVALDANNNIGITWIESSPTEYMSDWFAIHLAGSAPGAMSAPVLGWAGSSTLIYSFRSGDYGSLVVDPSNPTEFWGSEEYSPPNSGSDIWATSIYSFHAFSINDSDWYSVSLPAYDMISATTSTPGNGSIWGNQLDPSLALYDANGNLLASGYTLADGQNEQILYTTKTAGTYYIAVSSANGKSGEYYLNLAQAGIVVLDPSASGSVTVSGKGNVVVGAGNAIVVDSSSPSAVNLSSKGSLIAGELDVHGGAVATGTGTIQAFVNSGIPVASDPLAGLPAVPPQSPTYPAFYSSSGSTTLQPGTYHGGIHLNGTASVTLAPGIYYVQGGGLTVQGSASLLGTGVLIYDAAKDSKAGISFGGSASVNISAMTTGTYAGVAIFMVRGGTGPMNVSGHANVNIVGTVYGNTETLTDSSGQNLNISGANAMLVVYDVKNTDGGTLDPEPTPIPFTVVMSPAVPVSPAASTVVSAPPAVISPLASFAPVAGPVVVQPRPTVITFSAPVAAPQDAKPVRMAVDVHAMSADPGHELVPAVMAPAADTSHGSLQPFESIIGEDFSFETSRFGLGNVQLPTADGRRMTTDGATSVDAQTVDSFFGKLATGPAANGQADSGVGYDSRVAGLTAAILAGGYLAAPNAEETEDDRAGQTR